MKTRRRPNVLADATGVLRGGEALTRRCCQYDNLQVIYYNTLHYAII